MYEKWFVTTLTAIYTIWVRLNHKTCFQPRAHTAIDLFSHISSRAMKPLVPPDYTNRWTNFAFSAENMLQFKGTFLLRLRTPPCATKVKSMPLDNICLLLNYMVTARTQQLSCQSSEKTPHLGCSRSMWLSSCDTIQKKAHRIMHIQTRQL